MPSTSSAKRRHAERGQRPKAFQLQDAELGSNGRRENPEEERAVREFRRALMERDLLPPRHDDYYTMRSKAFAGFEVEEVSKFTERRISSIGSEHGIKQGRA